MTDTIPKVSVLMTVYNAERFLGEAIESVLGQTFSDFELLILDDCSRDSSWQIVQEYAQRDSRIRAIRNEKNLGGCENLNKGLRLIQSPYIARHDNDDWSFPDRLEKQVRFLDEHPEVGVVGGTIEIIDEMGKRLGYRRYALTDAAIRKKMFRYSPFAHPLVMVRKSVWDGVGGFYDPQFAPADDYDLWFRIGKAAQLANMADVLLKYRMVSGSITFRSTKKMELTTIRVRNRYHNDAAYHANVFDRIYNFLHWLSVGVLPAKWKIRLYNVFRND